MSALRAAGYTAPFQTVEQGVPQYLATLSGDAEQAHGA